MSEIDLLVRLRDAAAMILDACENRLDKLAPAEVKEDFDKLPWETKEGTKGPFQQTNEKASNNSELWQQLKGKLKEHHGFWQNADQKYWFDRQNDAVIDRRKTG